MKESSFEPKLPYNSGQYVASNTLDKDYANNVPTEVPTTSKKEKSVKRLSLNTFSLRNNN
jgi:hypothetical protein